MKTLIPNPNPPPQPGGYTYAHLVIPFRIYVEGKDFSMNIGKDWVRLIYAGRPYLSAFCLSDFREIHINDLTSLEKIIYEF